MLTEMQRITDWLKRDGAIPTEEEILDEVERRFKEMRQMYQEEHKRRMVAEDRLAIYEGCRP